MAKDLTIRIRGGWRCITWTAVVVITLAALAVGVLLPSDIIALTVKNEGPAAVIVTAACKEARTAQGVRPEPGDERAIRLFSGESHGQCGTWPVTLLVVDDVGKVLSVETKPARDYSLKVIVGR